VDEPWFRRVWGEATALLDRSRKFGWIDLLIIVGLAGVLFAIIHLAGEWAQEIRPTVEIDLSPWALPLYTFYSLMRGLLAYAISLLFTLLYGYWAAKDHVAERVLIPLLDILQSIPVLGFMPGLVLALVAAFPRSNVGLELAAVLMIFTGQAWNMTFSFYHSLRSVPLDQREAAQTYRFSWWQCFKWVELPFATVGLVWNSMMSMAGGWFFLMATEAFELKKKDFRLPGLGSYMKKAADAGDIAAQFWAIGAMTVMILLLDQLVWRPILVWAQKFRVEEGGHYVAMTSWFLNWLRRSRILAALHRGVRLFSAKRANRPPPSTHTDFSRFSPAVAKFSLVLLASLLAALTYGAWKLVEILQEVSVLQWAELVEAGFWNLGRVLLAVAVGTLWTLPAGLAIGLSPRLSRILQPVVQVVASFPAPMLFFLVIGLLSWAGVSLGWGSIVLMLLGTQWYILFNVIAGAMTIPADLREAARSYRITGWRRFRMLYFPAVFPYLVTGWVTATGGAWNASIVSEYVKYRGEILKTEGLGARISDATDSDQLALLAASILVMSTLVVVFNRTVWKRCYRLAEERFSLNK